MLTDFAWDIFTKTGSIDGYLLYKQTVTLKEKCEDYGACKDQWCCDTANQSEGQ
ncbi:MAG: YqzL family protein [Clostridia bacterium]|nr:YqzL family protein [Clostridia bacterium]